MLCSDGVEIDWPYSSLISTSLPSEKVLALMANGCAATRFLAHADLTVAQFFSLYRDRGWRLGKRYRHFGNKLREYKLDAFAFGIKSERALEIALGGKDRAVMMGRILELQD